MTPKLLPPAEIAMARHYVVSCVRLTEEQTDALLNHIDALQAENAQLRENHVMQQDAAFQNGVLAERAVSDGLRADLERKTKALEEIRRHPYTSDFASGVMHDLAAEALAPPTTPEPCFRRCAPRPDREVCAAKSGLIITRCICECHEEPGGDKA